MLLLSLLLASSAAIFDAPDSTSWILQPELRSTGLTGLPGVNGFYTPPTTSTELRVLGTDAGAGGGGFQLRVNARTPRKRDFSGVFGLGFGRFSGTWDNQIKLQSSLGTESYEAKLEHTATYLDLVAGVEWRPTNRHAAILQLASPIQMGKGTLAYKVGGTTLYDGDAPDSFRLSAFPRVMAGYEYRLFGRIAIGLDLSILGVDAYAQTPTFTTNDGDVRTLSDKAIGNTWMELHLGWAFSL